MLAWFLKGQDDLVLHAFEVQRLELLNKTHLSCSHCFAQHELPHPAVFISLPVPSPCNKNLGLPLALK